MKFLLALALPIYALDQATKWWILGKSGGDLWWNQTVIPNFFALTYAENTGAAFSMLSDSNTGFLIVSLIALVGLVIAAIRNVFPDRLSKIGVGLLVGGILGNVTDRVIHGFVVDFLLFDLHVRFANPWPVFNVADSAICIAVGVFILASFLAQKPTAQSA